MVHPTSTATAGPGHPVEAGAVKRKASSRGQPRANSGPLTTKVAPAPGALSPSQVEGKKGGEGQADGSRNTESRSETAEGKGSFIEEPTAYRVNSLEESSRKLFQHKLKPLVVPLGRTRTEGVRTESTTKSHMGQQGRVNFKEIPIGALSPTLSEGACLSPLHSPPVRALGCFMFLKGTDKACKPSQKETKEGMSKVQQRQGDDVAVCDLTEPADTALEQLFKAEDQMDKLSRKPSLAQEDLQKRGVVAPLRLVAAPIPPSQAPSTMADVAESPESVDVSDTSAELAADSDLTALSHTLSRKKVWHDPHTTLLKLKASSSSTGGPLVHPLWDESSGSASSGLGQRLRSVLSLTSSLTSSRKGGAMSDASSNAFLDSLVSHVVVLDDVMSRHSGSDSSETSSVFEEA